MNTDVDYFDDKQKELLRHLVEDFGGPTSTARLLMIRRAPHGC